MVWHCWYDPDGKFRLTCVQPESLEQVSLSDGEATLRAHWRERLAAGDLVHAARLVRVYPQAFTGRRMYIPIYTHPYRDGMAFAERLARAAMCGRQPGCTLAFDPAY